MPLGKVGKDIIGEMSLKKARKMVQALGSEEGEPHVPGFTWAEVQEHNELSDFKRQRGNQSPLGGWVGFALLELRLSTEGKAT